METFKAYKLKRKIYDLIHINLLSKCDEIVSSKINVLDHEVGLRIFIPKNYNSKIIVYFHGGGWVFGSIASYHHTCDKLAFLTNCMVVCIDYSLAPEHKFPLALNECYEVVKQLSIRKRIIDKTFCEVILMGDSAGGNLAASLSLMIKKKNEFQIDKQILIYPVTHYNHSKSSPFLSVKKYGKNIFLNNRKINNYFNMYISKKEDIYNPYISLLLSSNLKNQPKTLIITAEFDLLRDEGIAYGKKLQDSHNYVKIYCIKGTVHGFFNYRIFSKKVAEVIEHINEFLD